jgi:hypothetical protein
VDDRSIYDIYISPRGGAALALAVHLGLIDWLDGHPRTAKEVSEHFGFNPRPTDSLLTALTALGILERRDAPRPERFFDPEDSYALSPNAARFLVTGRPESLAGLIAREFDSFITPQGLFDAMKSDAPRVYGERDPWDLHGESAQTARDFAAAMRSISARPAKALAEQPFWADRKHLVDVGGGSGVLAIEALRKWPHLSATVFEIPAVCPLAEELATAEGVGDRLRAVPGNMFAGGWPSGDVVLLSQILHDWPPDKGRRLLQMALESLGRGGLVLVHEKLLDPTRTRPVANALVSLDMLFWTEGQQYSETQIVEMLRSTGFPEVEVRPTVGYWSVVIGRKA